ncbi:MAG TPA: ABC transporter ATP-binding protein [Bdellovibrio sp.]|uniref:ABC transporter ATP-binding protein n=1 Tax=Bdellovibrio sp. TaxID=28201 RepID=UPI002F1AB0A5
MANLLEVKNVSMLFGGLAANKDVSFTLERGKVLGLIGPNGAGKTTLFNCMTGFLTPTHGDVIFNGKRINGLRPSKVCQLGMARTWQKVKPLAGMSVLENVMVGALCRTRSLKEARELARIQLEQVGLHTKQDLMAGALPIGERKKLEVARTLATQPSLLLLDEVMGGLNPSEREEMIALIGKINKNGITLVVIEHDMNAIMRVSHDVVVLNSGEMLAQGTPQEIVQNKAVVVAYLGEDDAEN